MESRPKRPAMLALLRFRSLASPLLCCCGEGRGGLLLAARWRVLLSLVHAASPQPPFLITACGPVARAAALAGLVRNRAWGLR